MSVVSTSEAADEESAVVLAGVERALMMLEEPGRDAVFWHLSRAGLGKADIPSKPNQFVRVLTEMFGPGAGFIEGRVVMEIKCMTSVALASTTFAEVVYELRVKSAYHRAPRDAGGPRGTAGLQLVEPQVQRKALGGMRAHISGFKCSGKAPKDL